MGAFFDLDSSPEREINVNSEGYFTVRANEAATERGFAWDTPSAATIGALNCVNLVDNNYGELNTGYLQYLFQAKSVNQFCTDVITLTRSNAWIAENPGVCTADPCTETVTIQVSTVVAADPTATVVSIINDSDSDELRAAKQLCIDDDQTQWDSNTEDCVNKCNDENRPWYNTDSNRCEAPNSASLEDALSSAENQATLSIFESFGTGGFTAPTTTTTTTTTTTSTVSSTSQCPTGQYYSFIRKTCLTSTTTAPAPTVTVVPEKTEEEKLAEASTSVNSGFTDFATKFGDGSAPTESSTKQVEGVTSAVMDSSSAFNFFSGNTSSATTVYAPVAAPVVVKAPAVSEAPQVFSAADADALFAALFSGGGFSFGW